MSGLPPDETVTIDLSGKYQVPISQKRLREYREQCQGKLEVTFECKNGTQLCSRQVLALSDYFYSKVNGAKTAGNSLTFSYPDHSREAIKFYLNQMHCIKSGPVDIITALEVIDFCHAGKTTFDSFERILVEQLIGSINNKTLPLGSELLIAVFLSRVQNYKNNYQQRIAKSLGDIPVVIGSLFMEFKSTTRINSRLIEVLVGRGIFNDDSHNYVTMQLMIYCRKLFELQKAVSHSEPKSAEKVIEYKFTPEPISSKSTGKRKSKNPPSLPTKRARSQNSLGKTSEMRLLAAPSQHMIKMKHKLCSCPRNAFTWLDDTSVVVTSCDGAKWTEGHCLVLNTHTGEKEEVYIGRSFVFSVAKVTDKKFITGNDNGYISILIDGELKKSVYQGAEDPFVAYVNGEVAVVTRRGTLSILDENLEQREFFDSGTYHPDRLCQSMSGNEKFIAAGNFNGLVTYWRRTGDKKPQTYEHRKCVVCVSVKGNLLASGSKDKTVQVWDMETKTRVAQFQHENEVWCVQFHNNWLITCSLDKTVRIWDVEAQKEIHKLPHSTYCKNFDLSPDKTLLAVACDASVVLWDFKNMTRIKEFKFRKDICDARFNPAGNKLIVGALIGDVYKIDLAFDSNN